MNPSVFSAREILELVGEETGDGNPLASFWHSRRAGLDGVTIIRRTGTGGGKRHEIEASDLPRLAREAEAAMRRFIAERACSDRPSGTRRVLPRRPRDLRIEALRAISALVSQCRARGVLSNDVQRTIRRTTPFTMLEVFRAMPAGGGL